MCEVEGPRSPLRLSSRCLGRRTVPGPPPQGAMRTRPPQGQWLAPRVPTHVGRDAARAMGLRPHVSVYFGRPLTPGPSSFGRPWLRLRQSPSATERFCEGRNTDPFFRGGPQGPVGLIGLTTKTSRRRTQRRRWTQFRWSYRGRWVSTGYPETWWWSTGYPWYSSCYWGSSRSTRSPTHWCPRRGSPSPRSNRRTTRSGTPSSSGTTRRSTSYDPRTTSRSRFRRGCWICPFSRYRSWTPPSGWSSPYGWGWACLGSDSTSRSSSSRSLSCRPSSRPSCSWKTLTTRCGPGTTSSVTCRDTPSPCLCSTTGSGNPRYPGLIQPTFY